MNSPILFFCLPSFSGGGAERVMVSLMRVLAKEARIKCMVLQEEGSLRQSMPSQCQIINLNHRSGKVAILAMARTFRTERPQTIISTMAYFNFLVMLGLFIARHKPKNIILREANTPSSTLQSASFGWIYRFLYRWLYKRADCIICNSSHVKEELLALNVADEKINIIPNPIDVVSIRKKSQEEVKLPNFKNPKLPFLVSIGRLTKQKGFDRLISWFDPATMPSNLLIIGDGPERDALIALRNKKGLQGRVFFLSYQKNPFPFIAKAKALLIASHWEGLPSIGLEALALGVKVIATSTSGGLNDLRREVPENILTITENKQGFIEEMRKTSQNSDQISSSSPLCYLPKSFHEDQVVCKYKSALQLDGQL